MALKSTGMNEPPAEPCDAVWSVVRGRPVGANAVEPGAAGLTVPEAVLTWARGHGLDPGNPDLRLLVTAADQAGAIVGEVAFLWHPLPGDEMARLRAELTGTDSRP